MSVSSAHHCSPPTAPPTSPPTTPAASDLGKRTLSGFFWLLSQALGSKLVTMAGQVVLAWLLSPEEFGLVGLAYTVTAFAALIQQAGLREILIHRQMHFARWANAAFWMSLTLGCVSAVIMAGLAPVAAWMYEDPRLIGLVLVLAATAPFSSLDIVSDAKLSSELRFRFLAVVKWVTAVGTMGLSIIFALMLPQTYAAYAFVLPVPIMTAVRLTMLWSAARPPLRRRMQIGRWKYLINDSAMLLLANFFIMLTWQGDYIILGVMHDPKTVGIYFFAFSLSIQTMQVFTSNLAGVLFPALSRLQDDPAHQTDAFLRAAGMLAVIGVPLCLLQAALAGPMMSILFNSWWLPAIRVLQLLSIGMAVRLVASPGGSLLQAQGRFRTYLIINAVNAIIFLALVYAGARLGEHPPQWLLWTARDLYAAVFVAGSVMIYFILIGPIFMYIAIRGGGGKLRDVWRVYAGPVAASILAVGPAVWLARQIPPMSSDHMRNFMRVLIIIAWSGLLYIPLIRFMAPGAWQGLVSRMGELLKGRGFRWVRRARAAVSAG